MQLKSFPEQAGKKPATEVAGFLQANYQSSPKDNLNVRVGS